MMKPSKEAYSAADELGRSIPPKDFLLYKNSLFIPLVEKLEDNDTIILSVKTPKFFIKGTKVYLTYSTNAVQDITKVLSEDDIKIIKDKLSIIYWDHFVNTNSTFSDKFIHIMYVIRKSDNSMELKCIEINSSNDVY